MSTQEPTLTEVYSPDEPVPLRSYGTMLGTFGALLAGVAFYAGRHRARPPSLGDTILLGIATHKIARIMTKAKVTSPLRAPFARTRGTSGPAEVEDVPRGAGIQRVLGDLVSCPFCMAPWVATALMGVRMIEPRAAQLLVRVFVAVAVSDFLQRAYAGLKT